MNINGAQNGNGIFRESGYAAGAAEKEKGQTGISEKGSIYAGDLKQETNSVYEKKLRAQKEAVKALIDGFQSDSQWTDSLEEGEKRIEELTVEAKEASAELNKLKEEKEKLKETYGITAEEEVLSNEAYQEDLKVYEELEEHWTKELDSALNQRMGVGRTMDETKILHGKLRTIIDAKKQEEEILEQASKEAVLGLADQAKDKIDEDLEAKKEQAEEAEEKKEETEEQREKIKEQVNTFPGESDTRQIQQMDIDQDKLMTEVKKIAQEQKLLEDELMGIKVDTRV